MAIDKQIYNNGINGHLSYWEIDSLPTDYEGLKSMFIDATKRRSIAEDMQRLSVIQENTRQELLQEGVKAEFYGSTAPRQMSKLEEEKRIIQVLTRASYGMNREKAYASSRWHKFMVKVKFIFNVKNWWNILMLRRSLKKRWKDERIKY
jgi:hypothetical protein